ncbi:MAG: hypothetical protein JNK05_40170 [Myxococcales bacterium]|nr:hypothetical protein [Myxococcales bacterium]
MDDGASIGVISIIITLVSIVLAVGLPLLIVWKVVMPLFKGAAQKQALLQTGVPAQVTVMAMQDTGTRINDNPMIQLTLNVEIPGRPVYQVVVQEIVPMLALGMLQPGRPLGARVDPNNPQSVAIDWSGQSAPPKVEQGGVARLLATGIAGNAQIVSCEPMPMPPVEGDSIVKFTVQVQVPDGRPNYSATFAQRVPPAVMGRFGPSTVVPCKVDASDPSKLVLDFWGWAGIPAPQAPQGLPAPAMSPTPFGAPAQPVPVAGGYPPPAAPGAGGGGGWPPT